MSKKIKLITKIVLISIILLGSLAYAALLYFPFSSLESEASQIKKLKAGSIKEVNSVIGNNPYTSKINSEKCRNIPTSDSASGYRSCEYILGVHSDLPKAELYKRIVKKGWQKHTFDRGTKIERFGFYNDDKTCAISDHVSAEAPEPNTGNLNRTVDYLIFACNSKVYDRNL